MIILLVIPFQTMYGQFSEMKPLHNTSASGQDIRQSIRVDFDHDGLIDLLEAFSSSSTNSSMYWYKNQGDGSFAAGEIVLDSIYYLWGIDARDMDGDGDEDVLFSHGNYYTNSGAKWIPFENGSFGTPQTIVDTASGILDATAIDVDGDGDLDVISAWDYADKMALQLNNGSGYFGAPTFFGFNAYAYRDLKYVDYDGDGDEDLMASSASRTIIYENDSSGSFTEIDTISSSVYSVGMKFVPIYPADMDLDGDMDFVYAHSSNNNILLAEHTASGFSVSIISGNNVAVRDLAINDINGDTLPDICYGSAGYVRVVENLGNNSYGSPIQIYNAPNSINTIALVDVVGDDVPDIVATTTTRDMIFWCEGGDSTSFGIPYYVSLGYASGAEMALGDMDGDGLKDLVFRTSWYGTCMYRYLGNGKFHSARLIKNPTNSSSFSDFQPNICDWDADGDEDILVIRDDDIRWYENNGTWLQSIQTIATQLNGFNHFITGDVNGDTLLDIIATRDGSGSSGSIGVLIYYGNGSGGYSTLGYVAFTNDVSSRRPALGDIDADGDLDIVVPSTTSNYGLQVIRNLGSGSWASASIVQTEGANGVKLADLNGDGYDDIVAVGEYNDNTLFWMKSNGDGSFQDADTIDHSGFMPTLETADYDSDGDIDVITTFNSGALRLFVNQDTGNFSAPVYLDDQSYTGYQLVNSDIEDDGDVDVFYTSNNPENIWLENLYNSVSITNVTLCDGDSVMIGNTYYDSAGVYSDTLSSSFGGDSIISLIINVAYANDSTVYDTVCAGSGWYTYDSSGTYIDTLTNSSGCDSVRTLHLVVLDTQLILMNETVCFGDSLYGYGSTGVYIDSFQNAAGCDSVRVLTLTVLDSAFAVIYDTICGGDSLMGYDSTGTYLDTFQTAFGCDSTRLLHLYVLDTTLTVIFDTACYGDTVMGFSTSGTYPMVYASANGCDSTIELHLHVFDSNGSAYADTICEGTSLDGYTTSGTYTDVFTDMNGCDSVRTLDLTVLDTTHWQLSAVICQGESYLGYTTSGTYQDVFPDNNGCDSTRILHLTVNPTYNNTHQPEFCEGDSVEVNGTWYTSSQSFSNTFTTVHGCDSIESWDIIANPLPAQPTITQNGNLLEAPTGFAAYEWYLNGNALANSNIATLFGQGDGSYTVTVWDGNDCSNTSAPFIVTGLESIEGQSFPFAAYPNPANQEVTLTMPQGTFHIEVLNAMGELVYTTQGQDQMKLDVSALTAGVWWIRLVDQNSTRAVLPLVKQ